MKKYLFVILSLVLFSACIDRKIERHCLNSGKVPNTLELEYCSVYTKTMSEFYYDHLKKCGNKAEQQLKTSSKEKTLLGNCLKNFGWNNPYNYLEGNTKI